MITKEERVTDIWEQFALTKDIKIRNELVFKYEHLVKITVCRLMPNYRNHSDYDDFISYGILGLIDAVEKFDYTKGVKFETYASIRIRGNIIDNLRKQDWVPSSLRYKIKKLEEAYAHLEAVNGSTPSEFEVARHLNIEIEELHKTLTYSYTSNIIYFEQLLSNSFSSATLYNGDDDPAENYEKQELKDILAKNIDMLSKKEKMVITLYYFEELNLKEIGLIIGVSESRISQIHSKALIKLRNSISRVL